MKKIIYYIILPIITIIGIPYSFINREKWNAFWRKVDNYFGVKSPHTKNFEKLQNKS